MPETVLLKLRPSRLISVHYYVATFVLWILALLAFRDVWNVIPDWRPLGTFRLQSIGAGLLAFLGLLTLLLAELKRLSTKYIVTDERLIRRDGVLRRRVNEMPHTKVERIELDQGIIERILRLGDLVIDTGEDTITFAALRGVNRVREEIHEQIAAHGRRV